MSNQVIVGRHPKLSRFKVHSAVRFGDKTGTSIEQAKSYIMLVQSGQSRLAERMLRDTNCRSDPAGISTWIEIHGGNLTASWIVNAQSVYLDVVLDQLRQNSEFRSAFMEAILHVDGRPKFIVCSANSELVWSCGIREAMISTWLLRPGFNLYGQVLNDAYDSLADSVVPRWGISRLLQPSSRDLGMSFSFKKTVLVISDSICRNIKHIDGGQVVSLSGALFSDVISASLELRLGDFGVVVINCGTNVAQRSSLVQQVEWAMMEEFLREIAALPSRPQIIFSGALPLPGANGVDSFNEMVADRLPSLPVHAINWSAHGGYPFIVDGVFKREYLKMDRADNFHLGPQGVRRLWRRWCSLVPSLKCVAYKLSTRRYAMDVRPGQRL